MVTARGPLCTAGFVRGTTHFMIDLVEDPAGAHRLIDLCTSVIIDWLKAQHKMMGDTVESIFILDDIVGFINEEHYKEFAHPYLKRICDAFPKDWVKIYHNDAEVDACLNYLPDCGFNVLNWGKQKDIAEVKQRIGDRMCLMGNVNPLEIGVRGTPEEVRDATLEVLEKSAGEGIILYVPEVLIAARAMKAGMGVLKPLLTAKGADRSAAGVLLMGTVRGDLHDIGKNLVGMMAEGAGFEVHDIGVDQSLEKFLAAAEQYKPDIIGMSALLTTPMTYMKTVVDGFEAKGMGHIKMAIGGAPISQMYADEIRADGYGSDASSAVDLFLRLAGKP